jgi:hypothetical protein
MATPQEDCAVTTNTIDDQLLAKLIEQLEQAGRAVVQLGPIRELWEQLAQPIEGKETDILEFGKNARAVCQQINELLDKPKCEYDNCVFDLYATAGTVPVAGRQSLRKLIGKTECDALLPYTGRAVWLALEEQSPDRLLSGLVIRALVFPDEDDYRDVMVSLAPLHVCAGELGLPAAELFAEAATFAGEGVAETIRVFGKRADVSLGAFGWKKVQTSYGTRFHATF